VQACFSLYSFDSEPYERIAIAHALNKMMISRAFREELYKTLGIRNIGELVEKVPKQILPEQFQSEWSGRDKRKIEVRKIWVASRGGVTWRGNLNIRLVSLKRVLMDRA